MTSAAILACLSVGIFSGSVASAITAAAQGMPPLTKAPGDPSAGREIVADIRTGLCLLCHPGPFPEVPFQGDLAPDLAGVGARLDPDEIRLRIVDSRQVNPDTIMPPFHSVERLRRVGERWQDEPILSAKAVEDVVAFLTTLTDGGAP